MENNTGWDIPVNCHKQYHVGSVTCPCTVPKNWVFPYDVHKTYETIRLKKRRKI